MKRVFPQKTYYELKEKLGEGLTSEVYKAFRVDQKAWTKQVVALKIIKSEKNVQILKNEFEKLSQVQSKYCVQMRSWENLPQGSALVLEYIEGKTLEEVYNDASLTEELVEELLVQIYLGLSALHRSQVFHGDLNLKNIIINTEGVVKLIDFGFYSSEKENWITPYFAAPELLRSGRPNVDSDLYSIIKIKTYLQSHFKSKQDIKSDLNFDLEKEIFLNEIRKTISRASKRRALANIVKKMTIENSKTTQIILSNNKKHYNNKFQAVFLISFFLFLFAPTYFFQKAQFSKIELRSMDWVSLSINGLPPQFAPIKAKKLRSGKYLLHWVSNQGSANESLKLTEKQTFLLNPLNKKL
jgi:serine/threonine protein kinase